MSEVNNTVKRCDRCKRLYEVTREDTDWKITYLGEKCDLCDDCYNYLIPVIKNEAAVRMKRGAIQNE